MKRAAKKALVPAAGAEALRVKQVLTHRSADISQIFPLQRASLHQHSQPQRETEAGEVSNCDGDTEGSLT